MDLPTTQTAIVQDSNGRLVVANDVPLPSLQADQVLIKTAFTALNPYDYKMPSSCPLPGALNGSDFVGTVCRIGDDASRRRPDIRVGDCVFGCVYTNNSKTPDVGAFAEYVRAPASLLFKLNDTGEGLGLEHAATLGVALETMCLALWHPSGLGLAHTPDVPLSAESRANVHVLVYGGSNATGTMALQLFRLSGYIPIAICSPKNFPLAKAYGAEHVFDYRDPSTASSVRKLTDDKLEYVLDCITDEHSTECCYAAIGRIGGRLATLELLPELRPGQTKRRKAVKQSFIDAHEVFGEGVNTDLPGYARPIDLEKHHFAVQWTEKFQKLIDNRKLRAHPVHVLEGRFETILEGLEMLKAGRVSGEKLVVRIS